MPIAVTYPGVYVEELPSGAHTITPVATNIAAFIGRAPIGPTDEPLTIFNYGDFIRAYGGLSYDYPLSYAVQDFFANGGSQAIIARLFEPTPGEGDGVAQLMFPPAPEPLPDGWQVGADTAKGATILPVSPPTGGGNAPDEGMMLTLGSDRTKYLVTGYAEANPAKKIAASVTIVPALTADVVQCTALGFTEGGAPSGWTVAGVSGSTVTVSGGSGLPEIGDTISFANDSATSYTIISEPKVTGTDQSALSAAFDVTPRPGAAYGAATIADAAALPMPRGWQMVGFTPGSTASTGTVTVIHGRNAPLAGDTFTVGSKPDIYVVDSFAPATAKTPTTTIAFHSMSGDPLDASVFCRCCAPNFSRSAPAEMGIKTGAKAGQNSFVAQRSAATSGTIDIGDTFTVGTDPQIYTVRYVDGSGTIYFLPAAQRDFAGMLTFAPTLTLVAANPGEWGNYLVAQADTQGITDTTAKQFVDQYGLTKEDLFNLTLVLKDARGRTVATERYLNQTVRTDGKAGLFPNRLDRTLATASNLARVGTLSMIPPGDGASAIGSGGDDGTYLETETYLGDKDLRTGMYLLEHADIFNLLCIPPDRRITDTTDEDLDDVVNHDAAQYCADRRAFFIADPPVAWKNFARTGQLASIDPQDVGITGQNAAGIEVARNAAVFFPRLIKEDILMKSRPATFSPGGTIAGVFAATDVARGVWKAPAGIDAGLANVSKLEFALTDDQNGQLNPLGINCLRQFPIIGPVVWGSRTLRGADQFEDDYKYISVRRLTLFIEESLRRGTQWAVFEPNGEALWSSLRLTVNSFLADLARQGAFYNYAVACDASTTTDDDIAQGKVNILVQIAPVKPAEFVVLQIQQLAGTKTG